MEAHLYVEMGVEEGFISLPPDIDIPGYSLTHKGLNLHQPFGPFCGSGLIFKGALRFDDGEDQSIILPVFTALPLDNPSELFILDMWETCFEPLEDAEDLLLPLDLLTGLNSRDLGYPLPVEADQQEPRTEIHHPDGEEECVLEGSVFFAIDHFAQANTWKKKPGYLFPRQPGCSRTFDV